MSRRRGGTDVAALRRAGPVFAALGDATRLGIVARLSARGPMSIKELTANTRVTRQAVTKHLHVLAMAGIVRDTWAGRDHLFEIEAQRLADARLWLDHVGAEWDAALLRLKESVEKNA